MICLCCLPLWLTDTFHRLIWQNLVPKFWARPKETTACSAFVQRSFTHSWTRPVQLLRRFADGTNSVVKSCITHALSWSQTSFRWKNSALLDTPHNYTLAKWRRFNSKQAIKEINGTVQENISVCSISVHVVLIHSESTLRIRLPAQCFFFLKRTTMPVAGIKCIYKSYVCSVRVSGGRRATSWGLEFPLLHLKGYKQST